MQLQWWCSASGVAWTGAWRAYPGIWLFVLALAWWYWHRYRGATVADIRPFGRIAAGLGLLSVWAALDWPLGTLGAGYLLWAHTGQFLLLAMVAPPLLIYGLPRTAIAAVERGRTPPGIRDWLFQPLPALLTFNVAVFVTHVPLIVDSLMVYQVGAALLDVAWLVTGVAFWWPIIATPPGRPALSPPWRITYVLLGTFAHMAVGIILVAVRYPLYSVYELAPPVGVLRLDDQTQAGGLMLGGGTLVVLTAVMLLVYLWMREEIAAERRA